MLQRRAPRTGDGYSAVLSPELRRDRGAGTYRASVPCTLADMQLDFEYVTIEMQKVCVRQRGSLQSYTTSLNRLPLRIL